MKSSTQSSPKKNYFKPPKDIDPDRWEYFLGIENVLNKAKEEKLTREIEQLAKAKRENWYRGRLSFKLHSAQLVIDQKYRVSPGLIFVAECSRQFGKSWWAVEKAVEVALSKPKAQIRYGTAYKTDLLDFIIPAFQKFFEDCPPSVKPEYKVQGSKFVFPNGSIIKLVGLDKNPNGLRGNTLDLIIIDEAGFVDKLDYIYESVIVPATTHRMSARVILISTPPNTPAHPFVDYAARAEISGAYAKFTIYDNPMLTPERIEQIASEIQGGKSSTKWRREYMCERITDSDLAIIPEWTDDLVAEVEKDRYYNLYHKYVGMDLGVKHFTAAIFGYYHFKKAALVIEDELMLNGPSLNTEILAHMIKGVEHRLWGNTQDWDKDKVFRRVSDNNNLHLIQDLGSLHKLDFFPTTKEALEAMINEVRVWVKNKRIIVSPNCKILAGAMKYGVWTMRKDKFAESKVYGHFDHVAAMVYLVRNISVSLNPIPADFGHENHNSWLGHVKDASMDEGIKNLAQSILPQKSKVGGFNKRY